MTVAKRKYDENTNKQGRAIALLLVLLFHGLLFFGLIENHFYRLDPPPATRGIEVVFEQEMNVPQGFRTNPAQKPMDNPPIINDPGNSAPASAQIADRNASTRPQPQTDTKPSDLSEHGDVETTAKPPVNERALFQSSGEGDREANTPNRVSDRGLFPGVGNADVSTRTPNTPTGPEHRMAITANLAGRSVVGTLPLPAYESQNQGKVVVEIIVDRDGKVTKATATPKGSTVQDAKLWRAAEEAARKARFNLKGDAPITQAGSITYVFKLN